MNLEEEIIKKVSQLFNEKADLFKSDPRFGYTVKPIDARYNRSWEITFSTKNLEEFTLMSPEEVVNSINDFLLFGITVSGDCVYVEINKHTFNRTHQFFLETFEHTESFLDCFINYCKN